MQLVSVAPEAIVHPDEVAICIPTELVTEATSNDWLGMTTLKGPGDPEWARRRVLAGVVPAPKITCHEYVSAVLADPLK